MTDAGEGGTERERVSIPEQVELPRLLDFYDFQTEADTRIHQFYENLRAGELTTTRCEDCGAIHYPPRVVCPECMGEDLSYVDLPERGELFAFSEVRAGAPLSARIDDARSDDLSIGDEVELKVIEIDGPADHERVWYRFVPVEA